MPLDIDPWKTAETLLAKAATPGDLALIEALAKKLEPRLAKALLEAFSKVADSINVEALANALASGNVERAMSALGLDQQGAAFSAVRSALESGVWDAAMATGPRIERITKAEFEFRRLNPVLVDWLENYNFNLIKETTKKTKEAVQDVMIEGMKAGENPRTTAREVKSIIGLTMRQRRAVRAFRKELENFHNKRNANDWNLGGKISRAPGGAQTYAIDEKGDPKDGINARRLRDFRFDGTLAKAIKTKKPLTKAQIDKMVKAYTRKYLKFRAETIARTEAQRANMVGVQEAWRQMIADGKIAESLVRRQWIVTKDERSCLICKPIPSMNPPLGVPFATPFATPVGPIMLPPGPHPQCRCAVFIRFYEPQQLSQFVPVKSVLT
jgi:hypothetical protein